MAKADEIGEFGLIDRIRARRTVHGEDVVVGIGDDCAVIRRGPDLEVLTTDCLVEGTHYEPGWMTMKDIGWKAIAVNVSDVAAMGGRPGQVLVTLFLPEGFTTGQLDDLYEGMEECGQRMGVSIVGGDIVRIDGPFAVSIMLTGICERDRIVLRSGARKGDVIAVTGALGESSVGLKLLQAGIGIVDDPGAAGSAEDRSAGSGDATGEAQGAGSAHGVDDAHGAGEAHAEACLERFRRPVPRLREARAITRGLLPSSMIDISDGLLSDLWHILDASNAGAVLDANSIPVGQGIIDYLDGDREAAVSQALSGGEDYELLFTIDCRHEEDLPGIASKLGTEITPIGKITARGSGVKLADEEGERDVGRGGFDHFKPADRQGRG
jgi:thiamine-monophosphate kinase